MTTAGPGDDPLDVLTFGETMAALRATGPIRLGGTMHLSVAGAESTVAIGLARLGHRSGWVGRVGNDEYGALVLRTLRAEGVDVRHARTDAEGRPTGLMARESRLDGLVRVLYHRRDSAGSAIEAADVLLALHPRIRILHLTGITPALSPAAAEATRVTAARARELDITVSFDVNYRSRLWTTTDQARAALVPLASAADIIIASADELPLVSADSPVPLDEQDAVAALLARGAREVVVTRGGDGAETTTSVGTFRTAAHRVPVNDVVGAGDAFVAGYLSGVLDGLDAPGRLRRAAATSAFAVAERGDWEGLPTRADLTLLDHAPGTTLR